MLTDVILSEIDSTSEDEEEEGEWKEYVLGPKSIESEVSKS